MGGSIALGNVGYNEALVLPWELKGVVLYAAMWWYCATRNNAF
jgi:hypothetical protein